MVVRDENGLGHESAGIVIEVGEGVTEFKVGESHIPNPHKFY
jgi:L-iditol 2-dehydrogenase